MAQRINVLVPMAGEGSRFKQAGIDIPKPFISVKGKPMINYALDNVKCADYIMNFILICRREHIENYPEHAEKLIERYDPEVLLVDKLTEGAACTTLIAKSFINKDDALFIINCDQFLEWDVKDFYQNALKVDGCIVTLETNRADFSYARTNECGWVVETAEKKPISPHGTVGYYFWRRGADYVVAAESMIAQNIRVNNEFYVCPTYNEGIRAGLRVSIYDVKKMWCLGTPQDVENFERDYVS
jgi:NDP-sugar pyrophosphorylase family protein